MTSVELVAVFPDYAVLFLEKIRIPLVFVVAAWVQVVIATDPDLPLVLVPAYKSSFCRHREGKHEQKRENQYYFHCRTPGRLSTRKRIESINVSQGRSADAL